MFHGSLVALVTPMAEEGSIDIDSLRKLLEWHIEQGTDGIVVLGSTGEAATIDAKERQHIIHHSVEHVKGRVPVIAGTGTNNTRSTIELTRQAMDLGVDGCLLVTPYYNRPTQEGLYQHYKAVAEAVAVPQILYNVPTRTACDLLPTTVARLMHIPNIVGIKEAVGTARCQELLAACDQHIDIFSGSDVSAMEDMLSGAKGVISVTANIAPKQCKQLADAALQGHRAVAEKIDYQLADFYEQQSVEVNPIPVKWAMFDLQHIPAGIRLPLTKLSEQYHQAVRQAAQKAVAELD